MITKSVSLGGFFLIVSKFESPVKWQLMLGGEGLETRYWPGPDIRNYHLGDIGKTERQSIGQWLVARGITTPEFYKQVDEALDSMA